jgi:hypothetical protein
MLRRAVNPWAGGRHTYTYVCEVSSFLASEPSPGYMNPGTASGRPVTRRGPSALGWPARRWRSGRHGAVRRVELDLGAGRGRARAARGARPRHAQAPAVEGAVEQTHGGRAGVERLLRVGRGYRHIGVLEPARPAGHASVCRVRGKVGGRALRPGVEEYKGLVADGRRRASSGVPTRVSMPTVYWRE